MKDLFKKVIIRIIKWNRNYTNQPEKSQEIHFIRHKTVKTIFLKGNIFTTFSKLGFATLGACAVWSSFYDWNKTPEQQLSAALSSLSVHDKIVQLNGFDLLNNALFITKRVFSGAVGIPVGSSLLIQPKLFSTLLNITESPDPTLSLKAYVWLYKLSTYNPTKKKARGLLLNADPKLEKIGKALKARDYGSDRSWIMASSLLFGMNVADYMDKKILSEGIESLATSGNPLALSTAIQLYTLTSGLELKDKTREQIENNIKSDFSEITPYLNEIGVFHVPEYESHQELRKTFQTKANLKTIVAFSVFAAIWGKWRWFLRTRTSSEFGELMRRDPEQASQVRKLFLKNRTVGRSVFILFMIDYLCSNLLPFASGENISFNSESPIQLPREMKNLNYPLSSALPMAQTTLVILGAIYLINRQRYVVLPLLLAGSYNNSDLFNNSLFNHYCDEFEKMVTQKFKSNF